MATEQVGAPPETPPVWQPRFLAFALASGCGIAGMWGQRLVVGWLLWQTTQSGAWLTALGAAELLPILGLGILIGGMIDRRDVRRVLRLGQWAATTAGLMLLVAAAYGRVDAPVLVAIAALSALFGMVVLTARVAATGLLVAPRALPQATGLVNMAGHIGLAAGPLLVGSQLASGGILAAVAASTAFLALSALLFGLVPHVSRSAQSESIGFFQSLAEGLRHVIAQPVIRLALTAFLVSILAGRGMHDVLPAFVAAALDGGPSLLSQMIAAGGLGSLGVSIYLMAGGSLDHRKQLMAGLLLVLLAFVALAAAQSLPALVGSLMLGIGLSLTSAAAQCLVLAHTVPGLVGRTMSVYTMIWRGGPPLGVMLLGLLAEQWTVTALPSILAAATSMVVVVLVYSLRAGNRPSVHDA